MPERPLTTIAVERGLAGGPFGSNLVNTDYAPIGIPVIRGANMAGRFVGGDFAFVAEDKFARDLSRNTAHPGDLVFTQRGTLGQVSVVPSEPYSIYVLSQSQMRLRVDPAQADPWFVYYACRSAGFLKQIVNRAVTTGVPHINLGTLGQLTIPDLAVDKQRSIAEVLGAIDDKIASNSNQERLLQELAAAHLRRAVLDAPRRVTVGEVAVFHNRLRVPLSSRERELRTGPVPYYGAAGRTGWIDEPIFDQVLILVGEDGTVITKEERPVIQYIWGPAWVNNHAHVLTGGTLSTEVLRLVLQRHSIAHLVTGAVQPKLSMGRLKSLEIEVPQDLDTLDALIQQLADAERGISDETKRLERTRDELLPLLMSGRITVSDAEALV